MFFYYTTIIIFWHAQYIVFMKLSDYLYVACYICYCPLPYFFKALWAQYFVSLRLLVSCCLLLFLLFCPISYLIPIFRLYLYAKILTHTFLFLGPSNSTKYIPCHVPSKILPFSTISCSENPIMLALRCAAELPSI